MAKLKEIPLSEPIAGHSGPIAKVVLREPTLADVMEIGEPQVIGRTADGTLYAVEHVGSIKAYLERCVQSPDALLLGQLCLADALAVKDALIGFFSTARLASLPASPTSSSST